MVDIVSVDVYTDPESNMSGQWNDLLDEYNGNKMLALSETGTLPDPDEMDLLGIDWSYLSPWTWEHIMNTYSDAGYTDAQLLAILQNLLSHEDIITLDELPVTPWRVLITGDLDGDGFVGLSDLDIILANWNQPIPLADERADPSGDNYVGLDDLDIVLANWNNGTVPANLVPEPATFALFMLMSVASTRRCRPVTQV